MENARPRGQKARILGLKLRLREMHAAGFTQGEMAEELGITQQAVSYHTRRMGLKFAVGFTAQRHAREGSNVARCSALEAAVLELLARVEKLERTLP